MLTDAQGLGVSTDVPEAIDAIDRFRSAVLGYRTGADAILDAVAADPDCALGQALAAALLLFLEDGTAAGRARPYIAAACKRLDRVGEREEMVIAAISAWQQGDTGQAASMHRLVAEHYPEDLISAKLGQYHYFNLGDSANMMLIADHVRAANKAVAYAYGMRAFALEQTHQLREAETAGRQAVSLQRDEPWAQHAVAHVMETQGRLTQGIAWLEGFADGWAGCNSFMVSHNYWHLALFHLDRDAADRALDLYDHHVWGHWKAYSQDQANAISLLARLEMRGVAVGDRWADVAGHVLAANRADSDSDSDSAAPRLHEHVEPFLDLHYLYALVRAGKRDAAAAMLDSLQAHAGAERERRPAWQALAVPAAIGVAAHGRGQWKLAAETLAPVLPDLHRLGGSHAQRDLFHQLHLHALIKAERHAEARPVIEARLRARPTVPVLHRQHAALLGGLGQSAAAARARAEADRLAKGYRSVA